MWFVGIRNRIVGGGNYWHYTADEDADLLACGLRNPPWYFRWDGSNWQEANRADGVVVGKWIGEADMPEMLRLPDAQKCVRCWSAAREELDRRQRASIVASKLAEGKPEVTEGKLVTLQNMGTGEEVRCCVAPCAGMPDDVWVCSASSALAKAILGRFAGDEVVVEAPAGRVKYLIL